MRRVIRIKAMQSLYAYFNNKEVNQADVRQKVFDQLIEEPDFYNAQPAEKKGFQQLLPVLLDEAFTGKIDLSELPENQKWLGKLAAQTVSEWYQQNEAVKKRIFSELKADLNLQKPTEIFFWKTLVELIFRIENQEERKQHNLLDSSPSPEHELKLVHHPYLAILQKGIIDKKGKPQAGIKPLENDDMIRLFQYLFRDMPEYQTYKVKKSVSPDEEEEIWKILYRKLFRSGIFNEIMSERDMHWSENRILLEVRLKKTFKSLSQGEVPNFEDEPEELEEYNHFFHVLFQNSMDKFEEDDELIRTALKNWDPERVALLDKYIIHLSMTEMREFPHIPVKVTINEYLEIAKAYSTPGSAGFINGVVDKLSKTLKESGNMKKSARGLMDNK